MLIWIAEDLNWPNGSHFSSESQEIWSSPHNPLCAPAWSWFLCNLKIEFVTFQQKCHTHCMYKQLWNILTINQFKSLSKKNMFLREKIPARKKPILLDRDQRDYLWREIKTYSKLASKSRQPWVSLFLWFLSFSPLLF